MKTIFIINEMGVRFKGNVLKYWMIAYKYVEKDSKAMRGDIESSVF